MKSNQYTKFSWFKRFSFFDCSLGFIGVLAVVIITCIAIVRIPGIGVPTMAEEIHNIKLELQEIQSKLEKPEIVFLEIQGDEAAFIKVTVTAYNAESNQTDSTPKITASNTRVRDGICALSRDLESVLGLKFGDTIGLEIEGKVKYLVFEDRMNKRIKRTVDIFMWSRKKALNFGKQQGVMFAKDPNHFRSTEIRQDLTP